MNAGVRFATVVAIGPGNHGLFQKSTILGGCRKTMSYSVKKHLVLFEGDNRASRAYINGMSLSQIKRS
jgi:hypothetical protein